MLTLVLSVFEFNLDKILEFGIAADLLSEVKPNVEVDNLDDVLHSRGMNFHKCTIVLIEGDSAKQMAVTVCYLLKDIVDA